MKQTDTPSSCNSLLWDSYVVAATRSLFSLPFAKFCIFVFIVIVLQNGVWSVPNVEIVRKMSLNLTRNVLPADLQYLYTSFLGLALGWVTGAARSHNAFLALHLVSLCAGYFIIAFQIRKKYGDPTARIVVLVFASIPLSNVLITWLGTSDVYVYIFGTALAIASQPGSILIFSFLLGLSHFEQSCFIVLLLIVWRITEYDAQRKSTIHPAFICMAMVTGVILAKISLKIYFSTLDFNIISSRITYVMNFPLRQFLENYFKNIGVTLFSLQNVLWIFIAAICAELWSKNFKYSLCIIITHLIPMSVALIVLDTTRNFTLIIWPSIVSMLIILAKNELLPLSDMKKMITAVFVLNIIVPKLIVWEGKIHSSVAYYDVLRCLGHFEGTVMTPFR